MIQRNFQLLFKVEISHTYFAEGKCKCLQFVPTTATKKVLNRYGFLYRNNINGFDLFASFTNEAETFFNYIQQTTELSAFEFRIKNDHSQFYNFTQFPIDWIGQLEYNTSDSNNNFDGKVVQLSEHLSEQSDNNDAGSLTIQLKDILKYRNENGFAHFNILLKARATQWQYYVINKNSMISNLAIGSKSDISFSGPEPVVTASGQQATLFSSANELIPLSEKPQYKFDLLHNTAAEKNDNEKKSSGSKIIIKGLPHPDPRWVGRAEINGHQILSSPIYIYI